MARTAKNIQSGYCERYFIYAEAHGRTPERQAEHDKAHRPGACMLDYIQWIDYWKRECEKQRPDLFIAGHRVTNHAQFTAWLKDNAIAKGGTA